MKYIDVYKKRLALRQKKTTLEENNTYVKSEELKQQYTFVYNYYTDSIEYVSSSIKEVTGYFPSLFTFDFLLNTIHEDDYNHFLASEEQMIEFNNKLNGHEYFQYITSYGFSIYKSDGSVVFIEQQCQALEVNSKGDLVKVIVTHKVISPTNYKRSSEFKVYDCINNVYVDQDNKYGLTSREIEVLSLIKIGLDSKGISDKLHLSKHTIATHRKNILFKTESKSFMQLFQKLGAISI